MLAIHLNNGDTLTTDTSFEEFQVGYEDANYNCVRVWRHADAFDPEKSLIDTVIDKQEIAYIDILEG